jgi:Permuted papain-like amidase enzyme, YaeF/YiiX, C92 family
MSDQHTDTLTAAMRGLALLGGDERPHDADHLVGQLQASYHQLFHTDFAAYDIAALLPRTAQLQRQLFDLRLKLRANIPDWDRAGLMTHPAQIAVRDVFRASRYASDMLAELHLDHVRLGEGDAAIPAFRGSDLFVQLNPAFGNGPLEFLPGDVVLQRGRAHNSAAIARIGDVDSQFSHVGLIATNADGKLVVVEALIEAGSVITPINHNFEHGMGRAVLFRHRDATLAAEAAALIHRYIAAANVDGTSSIPYDFSMQLGSYHPLFCSKLVRMAYAMASDGTYQMPRYPTRLTMQNRDFLNRIGVTAHETFAPGDIEIEPDFDIVAEWRDCRITSELRLKDLIMTKLFAWMEADNYRFEPGLSIDMAALLARASTYMPQGVQDIVASVVAKIPADMSFDTIGAIAMLHKTAEPLYLELQQLELDQIATTGHQLHPRQVFSALESIRARHPTTIGYLVRS